MSTRAIDNSRTSERLSVFLSEIHASMPENQIFVELPTLDYLMKGSKKKAMGRQVMASLDTAVNSSIKSFSDTDAFTVTIPDTARTAVYPLKNYGGVFAISQEEMWETEGADHKIFDLAKHRRSNVVNSVKDRLNSDLYAISVGSKDINSLPAIITTSRSHGGIDSSSNSWWDSQETTSVGAFASNGLSNMRSLANDIYATGAGKPGWWVTTQSVLESYESELDVDVRYAGAQSTMGRGPEYLQWKNSPIVFDDDCPTGHMYAINSKHLIFNVHPQASFGNGFGKVIESYNSHVFAAKFAVRLQLYSVQPRGLGRLTGIT
jgi:hypothetical protein